MTDLTPLALKDAPALIEAVFPAQKVVVSRSWWKFEGGVISG
jgi:hypothetical protein